MPDIEFPTSAGTTPGYLAVPAGERGPATIVLQEWWGLTSTSAPCAIASPRRASSRSRPTCIEARRRPSRARPNRR